MSESAGTGNTAPGLTTSAALLFIWALLTLIVRAWVKLRKSDSWGIDDTTISLSFLLAFFHVVATCYAVNHGYGNSWPDLASDDVVQINKSLYAAQILYVTSIGLTKASISLFNTRLTRNTTKVRISYAVTGLCAAWVIASVLTLAIRGDMAEPWDTVDGSQLMFVHWMGIEITACILEFSLWALSVSFIWSLHMPTSKKLSVGAIFACRLAVVPIVGLRLYYLSPSTNPERSRPAITAGIYTEIAMELAFMLSNITCLKPFLRPFHSGYFVSTIDTKNSGYPTTKGSTSRSDAYFMMSTARSTADTTDETTVQGEESGTREGRNVERRSHGHGKAPAFRPDRTSHRAMVLSDTDEQIMSGSGAGEREGSEDMIISKTQAWTVSYEDALRKSSVSIQR